MKDLKKVLSGLALIAAFGGSAQAAMINVGGVTWDPDTTGGTDADFTARYKFNEFFTTSANAVARDPDSLLVPAHQKTPNYNFAVDPTAVTLGHVLQGVGEITSFNGVDYGNTASLTGGAFCPSCELTFVFGGFTINSPTSFTNGWLKIFVDNTPDFNAASTDLNHAKNAADGKLFLELQSSSTAFLGAGGFDAGFFTGYFDVVGGLAASNFDTNTKKFAADLFQSAAAQFGNPAPFQFIATSTGQIQGNTIPEPSTIFLMSLAMLGMAFARGRSKV